MAVAAKICGLNTQEGLDAALRHGAAMVGFNFFARSPRFVTAEQAESLSAHVPQQVERVGVMVDPDDALLRQAITSGNLSMVQLHGLEDARRAADVRERFEVKVMKVIRVSQPSDLDQVPAFEPVVDYLMFDAKPPKDATRPGGNAVAFDWRILAGRTWRRPWLLSGGLDVGNVRQAVDVTGARFVDVASGVESAAGRKDPALIRAFLEETRAI
jgi:phosphoribosylanthranilate isomerase